MTTYDSGNPYDAPLTFDGDVPVATPSNLPQFTMKATDLNGVTADVPAATLDQVAFEFSEKSALTFKIAEDTPGYDQVAELSLMQLFMNGALVDDGQWTVRAVKKTRSELRQVKEVTAYHRLWDALERTVVMTETGPAKRYFYSTKTIGYIVNDLLQDAKARNVRTVKDLTWSFNTAVDSAGNAWPMVFSIEYRPGTSYDEILANWVDRGQIEVRLRGNELQLFVADKMGEVSNADLVIGRDLTEAPVDSSAEDLGGVVVVVGDDDQTVIRSNATTIAKYGREERSESQGGTSDVGSLNVVGDSVLSGSADLRQQRTYGVVMRPGAPSLPLRDYAVSDFVRVSEITEGMLVQSDSYRVRQLVLSFQGGQVLTAAVVLNDKFLESEIRMAKKVAGIIGGAVVTGSSRTSTPDDLKDKTVPNPPTGVAGSSTAYVDVNGVTKAQATFSWSAPTTNTDGSVVTDIDHYRAAWRYSSDTVWQWADTDQQVLFLSPLDPGRDLLFYVRAIDTTGHWSGNQPQPYVLTLGNDVTPPPVPPAPVMTSIMGTVGCAWNGQGAAGESMPSDFDRLEVATSKVNNFDFGDGTLQGSLFGPGDLIFHGYKIGDVVYARSRTVDRAGNASAQSAIASITVRGISGPDIEANSIATNHLQAGSVTAVTIQAGAVTTDKVTIGQTDNLVQDPGFSDQNWRSRRLTKEFAENPIYWFFTDQYIGRSGYYLQLLSTANGVNGGKMFMTDWINVQMGETYTVGCMDRIGQYTPNPEALLQFGWDIVLNDGTQTSSWVSVSPTTTWYRDYYRLKIPDNYRKVKFWVRAYQLYSGDFAIDDFEVRCAIGTSAVTGGRIELTALGLRMWDDLENQTVSIEPLTGNVTVQGTIQSGFTGKRIVVAPGSTYLPEMRFYPTTGDSFAYINSSDSGSFPFIGVNAPDNSSTNISNAMILYDVNSLIGAVNKNTGEVQAGIGVMGMTKATSEVAIYGRLTYNTESHRLFSGGKFNCGSPTYNTATTLAAVIGKPAAAPSGTQWMLMFTPQRNAADKFFSMPTGETSSSTTVGFYPNTTWGTSPSPAMFANFMFVRVDA